MQRTIRYLMSKEVKMKKLQMFKSGEETMVKDSNGKLSILTKPSHQ